MRTACKAWPTTRLWLKPRPLTRVPPLLSRTGMMRVARAIGLAEDGVEVAVEAGEDFRVHPAAALINVLFQRDAEVVEHFLDRLAEAGPGEAKRLGLQRQTFLASEPAAADVVAGDVGAA